MKRFVEGVDRSQATLFPEYLEDWVGEDNPWTRASVTSETDIAAITSRNHVSRLKTLLLGSQIAPQGDTYTGQRIPAGRVANFVDCRKLGRQRGRITGQQAIGKFMQRLVTGAQTCRAQVCKADSVGPLLGMTFY